MNYHPTLILQSLTLPPLRWRQLVQQAAALLLAKLNWLTRQLIQIHLLMTTHLMTALERERSVATCWELYQTYSAGIYIPSGRQLYVSSNYH
jgi:hypothetical protein